MREYGPTCRRCFIAMTSAEVAAYSSYCEDCYTETAPRYAVAHPIGKKYGRSGDGRVGHKNIEKHE